jgi:quinol monooxygenase YgiN
MSKTVTVTLHAKPGKEEELKATLIRLIPPSRGEKGCLDYHIAQSSDNPGNFVAFMVYENEEAFKRHEASDLIQNLRNKQLPALVDEGPKFEDWRDLG